MKFSKYNNPNKRNKRKSRKRSPYSKAYIEECREQMYQELAKCKTESERDMIIKAFYVSINP